MLVRGPGGELAAGRLAAEGDAQGDAPRRGYPAQVHRRLGGVHQRGRRTVDPRPGRTQSGSVREDFPRRSGRRQRSAPALEEALDSVEAAGGPAPRPRPDPPFLTSQRLANRASVWGPRLDSGMDERDDMLARLRDGGTADPRVLAAMGSVPREQFVLEADRAQAYADRAPPIAGGP